jgi:hypothetical protein
MIDLKVIRLFLSQFGSYLLFQPLYKLRMMDARRSLILVEHLLCFKINFDCVRIRDDYLTFNLFAPQYFLLVRVPVVQSVVSFYVFYSLQTFYVVTFYGYTTLFLFKAQNWLTWPILVPMQICLVLLVNPK